MQFLVRMEVGRIAPELEPELRVAEAARAKELAAAGVLQRLWRIPGRRANCGLWEAPDADRLHEALSSLPLFPYLDVTVEALARHPNDPGAAA